MVWLVRRVMPSDNKTDKETNQPMPTLQCANDCRRTKPMRQCPLVYYMAYEFNYNQYGQNYTFYHVFVVEKFVIIESPSIGRKCSLIIHINLVQIIVQKSFSDTSPQSMRYRIS